jgi:hypothetical protein
MPSANALDLVGMRFGRLTVLRRCKAKVRGYATWLCKCDCGKRKSFPTNVLRAKNSRSCGCLKRDVIRARHSDGGGDEGRRFRRIIASMKSRCTSPSNPDYKTYGALGVSVCQQWLDDWRTFAAEMGPRPSPSHTVDRIDVTGNYEPGNCRWATRFEQSINKRSTVRVIVNG